MAKNNKKYINVKIGYNVFEPSQLEEHKLVYNRKFKLKDYLDGLPEDKTWVIAHNYKIYENDDWHNVKVMPDDTISLMLIPEGGGQGSSGKDILRMVAMVALAVIVMITVGGMAAEAYAAGHLLAAVGYATLAATITVGGTLLINALLPPAGLKKNEDKNSTYGYDGAQNTAQEGIPVPVVYGKYRVAGNIVDNYTKLIGDTQYMYVRTVLNDGKIKSVSDIMVNDQPIANYTDIEYKASLGEDTSTPNEWFSEAVRPIFFNKHITTDFYTFNTTTDSDKLRFDIVFPSGLYKTKTKNGNNGFSAIPSFTLQYRPYGSSGSWYGFGAFTYNKVIFNDGGVSALSGVGYNETTKQIVSPITVTNSGNTYNLYNYAAYNNAGTPTSLPNINFIGSQSMFLYTNPITGLQDVAYKILTPSNSLKAKIKARAYIIHDSSQPTIGKYNIKIGYKKPSETTWNYFYNISGDVSANSNNGVISFETIIRNADFTLPTNEDYEIAIFGGIFETVEVSSPTPTGNGLFSVYGCQHDAFRYSYETGVLPRGRYEIRIKRNAEEALDDGTYKATDYAYLANVNEIDLDNIALNGVATLSLKIKMGEQISSLPKVTCLVEGSVVKKYDMDGNVVDNNYFTRYPAYMIADILTNTTRGRGVNPIRIDFAALAEAEAYQIEKGLQFNGVFEQSTNIYDAIALLCRVGHMSPIRVGNKYSFVLDKPSDPVMLFNESNILKDSLSISWLPITDRSNEIIYSYYPEDNDFKQASIRIIDPYAVNNGEDVRSASLNQVGVTNEAQARYDIERQLLENRYIKKTINFDAPLEAIGLSIGDVAIIQHSAANYGSGIGTGRLKSGSTTTSLNLDCEIEMESGYPYKVLVAIPSLKRYDITIQSISGNMVYVSGLPSSLDRCRRLVQGSLDLAISDIYDASPYDYIILEENPPAGLIAGAASLYDTDIIEEKTVNYTVGKTSVITVSSPFSAPPPERAIWMAGKQETIKEKYRLRSINGSDIYKRTLSFVEYNENIYGSLNSLIEPVITPSKIPPQVTGLAMVYQGNLFSGATTANVTVSWNVEDENYDGANVYASINGSDWKFYKTLYNVNSFEYTASNGDYLEFKVVAFNKFGKYAPINDAPIISKVITINSSIVDTIANMSNDGVLSKAEKPDFYRLWNSIISEYTVSGWVSTATNLGITTEVTAYQSSYNALNTYLTGLGLVAATPDYTTDIGIVRATFNQKFIDYNTASLALQAKINAAQKANNDNVTLSNSTKGLQNLNAGFDVYTNATGVPDYWLNWANGQLCDRISDDAGGYACQIHSNGGDNVGLKTQTVAIPANVPIILYAKVKLVSGTLIGAGMSCDYASSTLIFSTETDANGNSVGNGVVGQTYQFSKLIKATSPSSVMYIMNHYTSFGSVSAANNIIWYEAGWRYATQAEIQANKVLNDPLGTGVTLSAVITNEQTARVNGDTANANAISTLSTTVTNNYNTLNSAITNEQTARANGDSANASAISTVSAKLDVATNLFPYPRPKNLTDAPSSYGWFADIWAGSGAYNINYSVGDSYWKGSFYYIDRGQANAPATVRAARFNLEPLQCGFGAIYTNKPITVSARVYMAAIAGDAASVWLLVLDNSNNVVAYADTAGLPINNSIGMDKRQSWTFNFSSLPQNPIPANAYKLALVFRHDLSATNSSPPYQFLGFTDIKVEFGSVATAYTNEGNNTAIQAQTTVNQNAIATLSTSFSNYQISTNSTLNGLSTTVTNQQTSINGILGKASVLIDANGRITGWQAIGGGAVSDFIIYANKFKFEDGTNAFSIENGVVYMNNAKIKNLTADNIADNAISQVLTAYTEANLSIANNFNVADPWATNYSPANWTEIQSRQITATGKPILVSFSASLTGKPQGAVGMLYFLRVKRDGAIIADYGMVFSFYTAAQDAGITSATLVDLPAAGLHTYTVEVACVPVSNTAPYFSYARKRNITLTELKK